jgi:hypothetical protein
MSVAETYADVVPGGIAKAQVRATTFAGVDDVAYYEIPFLRNDSELTIKTAQSLDRRLREMGFSYMFEASIVCRATNKTNLIKIADQFCTNKIAMIITGENGLTFSSALLTDKFMGIHWQLLAGKDMGEERHFILKFMRALTNAEYTTIQGTPPVDGVVTPADVLNKLSSLVQADQAPGGLAKFEYGVGSYTDAVLIEGGTFDFETVGWVDSRKREHPYLIKGKVEANFMQTASAEMLLYDNMLFQKNDFQLTCIDGAVLALPYASGLGTTWGFEIGKDMDTPSMLKFAGNGRIKPSEWAALWT